MIGTNNFLSITNLKQPFSDYPCFIFQTPLIVTGHLDPFLGHWIEEKTKTLSQVAISMEAIEHFEQPIEKAFNGQTKESFLQAGEDCYRIKYLKQTASNKTPRVEIRSNSETISGEVLSRFTLTKTEFETTKKIIKQVMHSCDVKPDKLRRTRKLLSDLFPRQTHQQLQQFFNRRLKRPPD